MQLLLTDMLLLLTDVQLLLTDVQLLLTDVQLLLTDVRLAEALQRLLLDPLEDKTSFLKLSWPARHMTPSN